LFETCVLFFEHMVINLQTVEYVLASPRFLVQSCC
jgi:hypothetical protein